MAPRISEWAGNEAWQLHQADAKTVLFCCSSGDSSGATTGQKCTCTLTADTGH